MTKEPSNNPAPNDGSNKKTENNETPETPKETPTDPMEQFSDLMKSLINHDVSHESDKINTFQKSLKDSIETQKKAQEEMDTLQAKVEEITEDNHRLLYNQMNRRNPDAPKPKTVSKQELLDQISQSAQEDLTSRR